jgi:hypothetical protein
MALKRYWALLLLVGLVGVVLIARTQSEFQPHRPRAQPAKVRPSSLNPVRTSPRNTIRQVKTGPSRP